MGHTYSARFVRYPIETMLLVLREEIEFPARFVRLVPVACGQEDDRQGNHTRAAAESKKFSHANLKIFFVASATGIWSYGDKRR